MAEQFPELSDKLIAFVEAQKMFFVGTATDTSRVNLSPKGMDSLRVIDRNTVIWLNYTGSGNETAAHVHTHPRMTIMFCAFEGKPMILRLFGEAQAIHHNDAEWGTMISHFPNKEGARQIFKLTIDLVQTSCGFAVPNYEYQGDREILKKWAEQKGDEGIQAYWEQKNQMSIDAIPTHILEKNLKD